MASDLFESFIRNINGHLGNNIRHIYYKKRLKHLGNNTIIDTGVYITNPKCITIFDNTHIDKNVILVAGLPRPDRKTIKKNNLEYKKGRGEISIGKYCHIANNVILIGQGGVDIRDYVGIGANSMIYSQSHHYTSSDNSDKKIYKFTTMAPIDEQCVIEAPVVMDKNSALGANSVILPGTTINENSWVGVNSYVIGTIPSNVIAIGSPAKVIKKRVID